MSLGKQPETGEVPELGSATSEGSLELDEGVVEDDDLSPLDQKSLTPKEIPRFDIVESQERTRANLAYGLLGLLVVTLAGVGLFITFAPEGKNTEDNRELLTLIWTSELALVGSALGFYFGSQTKPR